MYHLPTNTRFSPRIAFAVTTMLLALIILGNPAVAQENTLGFGDVERDTNELPDAWQVLGNPRAGQPKFDVRRDDKQGKVLRLHARGNQSDGIYRAVNIDLTKTPFINFSWKVERHPDGRIGTRKDDQAIQVQLNFGRHGLRRRVLAYGFDAKAETGRWYDDSSFVAVNRVLVLNSGDEKLGEWVSHSRNVVKDYRASYGSRAPRLKNISIFCDSNDSRSESISYCTAIKFTDKPVSGDPARD